MISDRDLSQFRNMKKNWNDFKVERNKREFYGKCGPKWISINDREKYFDNLLNIMERWLTKTKGVENETDKSYG